MYIRWMSDIESIKYHARHDAHTQDLQTTVQFIIKMFLYWMTAQY